MGRWCILRLSGVFWVDGSRRLDGASVGRLMGVKLGEGGKRRNIEICALVPIAYLGRERGVTLMREGGFLVRLLDYVEFYFVMLGLSGLRT